MLFIVLNIFINPIIKVMSVKLYPDGVCSLQLCEHLQVFYSTLLFLGRFLDIPLLILI